MVWLGPRPLEGLGFQKMPFGLGSRKIDRYQQFVMAVSLLTPSSRSSLDATGAIFCDDREMPPTLRRVRFMTRQENELLQKFLAQLAQAHVSAKDPEAQAMIGRAVAQQPDAAYLLVQRALLLDRALQQAKSQLSRLHEQRDGADDGSHTWTQTPSSTPATAPAPASSPQAQAAPQTGGTGSGWGGFLGNAATTAAGVTGGAFLFQGLEGLFGHRGGGFVGGSAPTETVENVTVNDYSGDGDSSRFESAQDSTHSENWADGESSEFASADDSDSGLGGDDDFGDDSSWT